MTILADTVPQLCDDLDAMTAPSDRPHTWPGSVLPQDDAPMRCAECDCEKGGRDCNWIKWVEPPADLNSYEGAGHDPGEPYQGRAGG